jgi:hypothetical protein
MYFGTSSLVLCREVYHLCPYLGESTIGGSTVEGPPVRWPLWTGPHATYVCASAMLIVNTLLNMEHIRTYLHPKITIAIVFFIDNFYSLLLFTTTTGWEP